MRPFVIELLAEEVEPALLVGRGCFRRIAGFALERAVHALVAAVLLRLARIDPLQLNPHLRPARREPRQPAGASRGKRRTIVAAHRRSEEHPSELTLLMRHSY